MSEKNNELSYEAPEVLNEQTALPSLTEIDTVHVDFSQNRLINSLGIMRWTTWINSSDKVNFYLKNLSVSFMTQASLFPEVITDQIHIQSFYVPFFSAKGSKEVELLIDVEKDVKINSEGKVELLKQVEEEGQWEIDVLNNRYFSCVEAQLSK